MNEKVSVSKPMHAILELYLLFIGQENNDFIFLCTMLYDSFFFIVTETLKQQYFLWSQIFHKFLFSCISSHITSGHLACFMLSVVN